VVLYGHNVAIERTRVSSSPISALALARAPFTSNQALQRIAKERNTCEVMRLFCSPLFVATFAFPRRATRERFGFRVADLLGLGAHRTSKTLVSPIAILLRS